MSGGLVNWHDEGYNTSDDGDYYIGGLVSAGEGNSAT